MRLRWMRWYDGSWTCAATWRGITCHGSSVSRRVATLDAVQNCYSEARRMGLN